MSTHHISIDSWLAELGSIRSLFEMKTSPGGSSWQNPPESHTLPSFLHPAKQQGKVVAVAWAVRNGNAAREWCFKEKSPLFGP